MSTTISWESTKFTVWCTLDLSSVGGGAAECLDIMSVNTNFELNSMPTCVMSIAVGRRADNVSIVANIHNIISLLKLQIPVKVYCIATNRAGKGIRDKWPGGQFIIFDGYIQGSGFRRTAQGAEFTLYCIHWLADLNFSSSISQQSSPLNPQQYFFPAVSETGANKPLLIPGQYPQNYATLVNVPTDFWGKTLLPWLQAVSEFDLLNANQIFAKVGAGGPNFNPSKNDAAASALARFEPASSNYDLGVAMPLTGFDPSIGGQVCTAIALELGDNMNSYITATLWDKLAGEFHASFMYAIVPLVSSALVIPFAPGNSQIVHRMLGLEDYEAVDLQAAMPRPLRAVGIMVGMFQDNGAPLSKTAGYPGISGWFDKVAVAPNSSQAYLKGLIMLKRCTKVAV